MAMVRRREGYSNGDADAVTHSCLPDLATPGLPPPNDDAEGGNCAGRIWCPPPLAIQADSAWVCGLREGCMQRER